MKGGRKKIEIVMKLNKAKKKKNFLSFTQRSEKFRKKEKKLAPLLQFVTRKPFFENSHGPPGPRAVGALPGRPQRQVQRRGLRRAPGWRRSRREAARESGDDDDDDDECRSSSPPRRSPHGVFFSQACSSGGRSDVVLFDGDRERQAVSQKKGDSLPLCLCRRRRQLRECFAFGPLSCTLALLLLSFVFIRSERVLLESVSPRAQSQTEKKKQGKQARLEIEGGYRKTSARRSFSRRPHCLSLSHLLPPSTPRHPLFNPTAPPTRQRPRPPRQPPPPPPPRPRPSSARTRARSRTRPSSSSSPRRSARACSATATPRRRSRPRRSSRRRPRSSRPSRSSSSGSSTRRRPISENSRTTSRLASGGCGTLSRSASARSSRWGRRRRGRVCWGRWRGWQTWWTTSTGR